MRIAREEIFGPVLCVLRFRDEPRGDRIANGTIYGLAAAVWTRDIKLAHRMAAEISAGSVWINTYNAFDSGSPFGGYKQSGFGRDLGQLRAGAVHQREVGLDRTRISIMRPCHHLRERNPVRISALLGQWPRRFPASV